MKLIGTIVFVVLMVRLLSSGLLKIDLQGTAGVVQDVGGYALTGRPGGNDPVLQPGVANFNPSTGRIEQPAPLRNDPLQGRRATF